MDLAPLTFNNNTQLLSFVQFLVFFLLKTYYFHFFFVYLCTKRLMIDNNR
jgi:hypothetical protein